ncbi:MAG: thiamine pyridinylase [Candidatus Kentron sp. G]|nr:MAG: thiamine pyridinylase [Candidatus Kentron sp. G]VFN03697.1 MAG: thiamine pyridinylase [Candidatus Kentron sp. G]VFN04094.1 MAG: thiamine pyridinylase [Candidatus Kentron sp. G]
MRLRAHTFFAVVLLSLHAGCTTQPKAINAGFPLPTGHSEVVTLRVALHPYIPDAGRDQFDSLEKFIEQEFEKAYPQVDLVVRPITEADNFYELALFKKWLSGTAEETYDVVEPDAIFLGELVAAGLIRPWKETGPKDDWHPATLSAVTLNNAVYGVPHLLAGHFLFTRHSAVAKATNIGDLSRALLQLPGNRPRLVGKLTGSWNMPALYLDAWVDSNPARSPAYAFPKRLDPATLDALRRFSRLCEHDGMNPCLDGTFDDDTQPQRAAKMFARGKAHAFFGYSEQFHFVASVASDTSNIRVSSLPIGTGCTPLLYVDAFVLRAGASESVASAAEIFVQFMNSPRIQEQVMMSLDTSPRAKPRYLIPATLSAFEADSVKSDPHYAAIRDAIRNAISFPNVGILYTSTAAPKFGYHLCDTATPLSYIGLYINNQ